MRENLSFFFFPSFFLSQGLTLKPIVWGWSQTPHLLSAVLTTILSCLAEVPSKHCSQDLRVPRECEYVSLGTREDPVNGERLQVKTDRHSQQILQTSETWTQAGDSEKKREWGALVKQGEAWVKGRYPGWGGGFPLQLSSEGPPPHKGGCLCKDLKRHLRKSTTGVRTPAPQRHD